MVDMAGSGNVNRSIYSHLESNLQHLSKVGLTDWSSADPMNNIPMAKFFFAPDHAQIFFKQHGPAKATELMTGALFDFIKSIEGSIQIEYIEEFDTLQNTFNDMIKGKVNPKLAYIVKN